MKMVVDLSPLTGPELESWSTAFESARRHVVGDGDLERVMAALADIGHSERIRRTHGGLGPRPITVLLVDPDADPARADAVRNDLIVRVQTYRDAPWIGPRLAEALHLLLLDLADDRDRVRREHESVRDLVASRYHRGSVVVTDDD